MVDDWSDNELRNLYRKNGVYSVIKTIDDTVHVFAVFHDLEKAISYRDLFELSDWDLNLKGICDVSDAPIPSPPKKISKPKPEPKRTVPKVEVVPEIPEPEVIEEPEIIEEPEAIEEPIPEIEIAETPIENPPETVTPEPVTVEATKEPTDETTDEIPEEIIDDSSVDPFDDKYIYFDIDKGYTIKKGIGNKVEYFGQYDTIDEAIAARDYFEEHHWNLKDRLKFSKGHETKYIYKTLNDHYQIVKLIDGKHVSFGVYPTLEEAQTARDYFQEHDWNVEDKSKFKKSRAGNNPKRYIHKYGKRYIVRKRIGEKMVEFGQYKKLEDAQTARDYFEEHDWNPEDISLFEELQYTRENKNPKRFIVQTGNTWAVRRNSIHFGSFDDLDEAIAARDFLEQKDWSLEYKDKYHRKNKPESENYFENKKLF